MCNISMTLFIGVAPADWISNLIISIPNNPDGHFYCFRPCIREGNVFILSVSVCVCVCVGLSIRAIPFKSLGIETSFFGKVGHLDHIYIKFDYQGHWVKVKATLVNGLFKPLDTKFYLQWLSYGMNMVIKVLSRSTFFWDQGHSRIKLQVFTFLSQVVDGPSTECIFAFKEAAFFE